MTQDRRGPGSRGFRPERRVLRPDVRQDVDDEIAFHLEARAGEYADRGFSAHAARDEALRRFGNVEGVAALCRHIDEQWYREQRRASMWTDLRHDVAYALRALAKHKGFTATALLTLALGIGANAAIFSVINSVLLRQHPYRDADRLVFLWSTSQAFPREPLTPGRMLDFRDQMTSLEAMAGISHIPLNLTGSGEAERLGGSSVSSSFFDVLGTPALLGDPFHANRADERDVVLSYGLWTRRFGSDPGIIGRQIVLNGTARTVVAVMPREFDWPAITATPGTFEGPELWIPGTSRDIPRTPVDNGSDLAADRRSGYLRAVGRLKDGASIEQAGQEAESVAGRLAQAYPQHDGGRGATVIPLREQFVGHARQPMLVLLGAVVFVLAIACANIASLLLGRTAARRKEIAVRLALGASRARVVRQLLTESTVLALLSGIAGVFVALFAQRWLAAATPAGVPGIADATLDARVLVYTLAVAVLTGIVCGIVPAWQTTSSALNADLNEGGARSSAGPRSGRTRDVLVAAEIAVALVLLVGAALFLRSFNALARVDTGIDTRNLLTFDLFLNGERAQYQRLQVEFYNRALAAISALPGVKAAGAAVTLPIGGDDFAAGFHVEGTPEPPPGQRPRAGYQVVTPGYFDAMGMPIVAGRDVRDTDTQSAPRVVLVNETFASQQWPGQDPIGRRLTIGSGSTGWMTVVGVVGDIRHLGPGVPPRPEIYEAHSQSSFSFMAFVVRTHGDPQSVVQPLRAAIAKLDPMQPISGVATMEDHLARSLSKPKFISTLVGTFGAVALVLAIVGIYGVMAYAVAQRTREIAIRTALGARESQVMRLVLGKAVTLAAIGTACGLAAAYALSRAVEGMLFSIEATDPATYAGVALLLGATAVIAAFSPALRASRIDGAQVLRS
jgi:predicted permease